MAHAIRETSASTAAIAAKVAASPVVTPNTSVPIVHCGQALLVAPAGPDRFDRPELEDRLPARASGDMPARMCSAVCSCRWASSSSLSRSSSCRRVAEAKRRFRNRRSTLTSRPLVSGRRTGQSARSFPPSSGSRPGAAGARSRSTDRSARADCCRTAPNPTEWPLPARASAAADRGSLIQGENVAADLLDALAGP